MLRSRHFFLIFYCYFTYLFIATRQHLPGYLYPRDENMTLKFSGFFNVSRKKWEQKSNFLILEATISMVYLEQLFSAYFIKF